MEDDQAIATQIAAYVQHAGFVPVITHTGPTGIEHFHALRPVCVVLDRMLPGLDGLKVCKELRLSSDVPILFVTALISEQERLDGLRSGADDYIIKPFSLRELVARIEVVLRRSARVAKPAEGGPERQWQCGPLRLSEDHKTLYVSGQPISLTASELRLIRIMLSFPERVFTREELLSELYPYAEADVVDRAIDVHIGNIRKKLRESGVGAEEWLQTIRGFGYRVCCAEACLPNSSSSNSSL